MKDFPQAFMLRLHGTSGEGSPGVYVYWGRIVARQPRQRSGGSPYRGSKGVGSASAKGEGVLVGHRWLKVISDWTAPERVRA